jgi:hypothetical protein
MTGENMHLISINGFNPIEMCLCFSLAVVFTVVCDMLEAD